MSRKMMRVATVILALCTVHSSSAAGRTMFVDGKHVEAGDENDGTEAKPFKTIQAAVAKAEAGDTIWVKAGQYEETVEGAKTTVSLRIRGRDLVAGHKGSSAIGCSSPVPPVRTAGAPSCGARTTGCASTGPS